MNSELAQVCYWSDCGVIALKICERGLKCKDCPIELAMRSHASPVQSAEFRQPDYLKSIRSLMKSLYFSESCLYLKNHVVFRHLLANAYLTGLSDMMRLLFFNFELNVNGDGDKLSLTPSLELTSPLLKFHLTCPAKKILYNPFNDSPVGGQWNLIAELGAIPPEMVLTKREYINQKMKVTDEFLANLTTARLDASERDEEPYRYSYEIIGEESFIRLATFLGAESV